MEENKLLKIIAKIKTVLSAIDSSESSVIAIKIFEEEFRELLEKAEDNDTLVSISTQYHGRALIFLNEKESAIYRCGIKRKIPDELNLIINGFLDAFQRINGMGDSSSEFCMKLAWFEDYKFLASSVSKVLHICSCFETGACDFFRLPMACDDLDVC